MRRTWNGAVLKWTRIDGYYATTPMKRIKWNHLKKVFIFATKIKSRFCRVFEISITTLLMEALQLSSRFSVNRVTCTHNCTVNRRSNATFRSPFTGTNNSASLSSKNSSTVWLQTCLCFVFILTLDCSVWSFCVVCVELEGDMELGKIKDC